MRRIFSTVIFCLLASGYAYTQDLNGMATGNYAGVNGVSFNPASIADSRYKFDINLIGIHSLYSNNYLDVKNTAIIRRLFYKSPYSSSFDAVKRDLISESAPTNAKVFGQVSSNIALPFSFMATTGKRSAIAITMNNRTINKVDSMPVELARAFYSELRDPSLYGRDINVDSMQYNFLNWQEIGFTYSRVMMRSRHHMLKLGVTLKWLGANAGGYIQTDNAVVNFSDSNRMSLRSPLIRYARTKSADIGSFRRLDLFNNLEDQAFGWDAGLVYEFRAKVKKFRYVDAEGDDAIRRDLNKYMFRIGVSVVDVGRFTLNKQTLTNDHSANILNWDFSNVKANNFSDWDTAYAQQINYINGTSKTFTYRLPAAVLANFDLHLFGGLYVNVAAKAPLESFNKKADAYFRSNRWVAVTPRFEGKFLGVYVPVSRVNKRVNVGATVRLGPVYVGSNNLAEIVTNKSTKAADFHAGVRLGFPYGKPTRLSKSIENLLGKTDSDKNPYARQKEVDSLRLELDFMRRSLADSFKQPVRIIINNTDGATEVKDLNNADSIVISNKVSSKMRAQQQVSNDAIDKQTDSLVYELARKNMELNALKSAGSEEKSDGKKKNKKSRKSDKDPIQVETSNKDLEKEVERMRKQMQIQNAALIGGGTAAVIAATSGQKGGEKKNNENVPVVPAEAVQTQVTADSVVVNTIIVKDTVVVRDTVYLEGNATGTYKLLDRTVNPVLFASGSSSLSADDKKRLEELAAEVKLHADWRVELTGMTDSKGSVAANRKVAASRTNAVSRIFLAQGVKDNQIIIRSKLADSNTIAATDNPRRVSFKIYQKR